MTFHSIFEALVQILMSSDLLLSSLGPEVLQKMVYSHHFLQSHLFLRQWGDTLLLSNPSSGDLTTGSVISTMWEVTVHHKVKVLCAMLIILYNHIDLESFAKLKIILELKDIDLWRFHPTTDLFNRSSLSFGIYISFTVTCLLIYL